MSWFFTLPAKNSFSNASPVGWPIVWSFDILRFATQRVVDYGWLLKFTANAILLKVVVLAQTIWMARKSTYTSWHVMWWMQADFPTHSPSDTVSTWRVVQVAAGFKSTAAALPLTRCWPMQGWNYMKQRHETIITTNAIATTLHCLHHTNSCVESGTLGHCFHHTATILWYV